MPIAIEMFLAGVACGMEILSLINVSSTEKISQECIKIALAYNNKNR